MPRDKGGIELNRLQQLVTMMTRQIFIEHHELYGIGDRVTLRGDTFIVDITDDEDRVEIFVE